MTKTSIFISAVFLLCATAQGEITTCSTGDNCLVFLDLGSSGTKLKVYSWSVDPAKKSLPKVEIVGKSQKFKPGVSEFGNNVDGLRDYMIDIITQAKTLVPESKQATTPIFAMATAGMRFMDADDSRSVMTDLKDILKDSSLSPFVYDKADVQILSGEEEAVYAWVALNYLLGKFNSASRAEDTYGIMAMGGGSTQIAFKPKEPLYAGEFQVELLNNVYELYGHSYLGFGLNAIEIRIASFLHKMDSTRNPCLLEGDTKNYTLENGITVTNEGYSNPTVCSRIFKKLLESATGDACQPKPCAIGSQYQPHVKDVPFYATQGFLYAPEFFDAIKDDLTLNTWKLRRYGMDYCEKTLKEVTGSKYSKYASGRCLQSQYFPVLFHEAYNIPQNSIIKATSKMNGQGIDWALGAVLVELSHNLDINAAVKRRR